LRDKFLDIIKVDVKETRWECVGWIEVAKDMVQCWGLVNTVLSLGVPKTLEICDRPVQRGSGQPCRGLAWYSEPSREALAVALF
jgi:hypothetical protein